MEVGQLTLAYSKGTQIVAGTHVVWYLLYVACRKVYCGGGGEDGATGLADRKQVLANLSSAKLALHGVLSKAKVRSGRGMWIWSDSSMSSLGVWSDPKFRAGGNSGAAGS